MKAKTIWAGLVGAAMLICGATTAIAQPAWREAFQSSPATYEKPSDAFLEFARQHWHVPPEALLAELTPQPVTGTVRYQVTLMADGSRIRLRLSNQEGNAPLRLTAVTVGLAQGPFIVKPGSLHSVTFSGGSHGVTIPTAALVISDPVDLPVEFGTQLVVSAALASPMMNEGRGGSGFLLAPGDHTRDLAIARSSPLKGRSLVSGMSVLSSSAPHVIVTFGDSITDGNRVDPGAPHGWPERLAQRLKGRTRGGRYNVVNAGIAGNRLLAPGWGAAGLARLDRDALRIEGISHLILLEGINDINFSGQSPFGTNPDLSADELIAGYRQVIARAHERGVKVYIATLTPNPASELNTAAKVSLRESVNHWIRNSGEPDAVIDFEAMVRDPENPDAFKAVFDSGDHLHPSDAGYARMGDGIDLSLFP